MKMTKCDICGRDKTYANGKGWLCPKHSCLRKEQLQRKMFGPYVSFWNRLLYAFRYVKLYCKEN